MSCQRSVIARAACTCAILLAAVSTVHAQWGYGVDANTRLFRFRIDGFIATDTTIGNLGIVPEAIDFKPGTNELYAIDVGATTTQVYRVDINSAGVTPIGAGFPSTGAGYDLVNRRLGFDFNPKTLQADGTTMFIRVTSTATDNLRVNSTTGLLVAEDTDLSIQPSGASPFVEASAYINNIPEMGGTTLLFDMDSRNDALFTQNPANAGTLTEVGDFGVSIDAMAGIGFDIYTTPGDVDPTIVGDFGYAVYRRSGTANGAYLLYIVNLANGITAKGRPVNQVTPADFTGGFAIAPLPVPEPTSLVLLTSGAVALALRRRSKS